MRCAILQPSYLPWRGYFHQIQAVDTFVFYDDVQFDARGWRNRNRIKTSAGTRWLTVPVRKKGARSGGTTNQAIEISTERDWARRHWTTLEHSYGKAPFFEDYAPLVREHLEAAPTLLADLTIGLTMAIAGALGIEETRFVRSSSLAVEGRRTERLLRILQALGADRYLSGPSARSYLDEELLRAAGIRSSYMDYDYPEYPQLYPPYDPRVSIVDLLFMTGPRAGDYIWKSPG